MQRVLLFLATNFAILIVLSIAMQVLGIDDMLGVNAGFNTEGICLLCPIRVWRRLFIAGDFQIHGQTHHGCADHRTAQQRHRTLD